MYMYNASLHVYVYASTSISSWLSFPTYLPRWLSICLSIYLSTYLPVYLSVWVVNCLCPLHVHVCTCADLLQALCRKIHWWNLGDHDMCVCDHAAHKHYDVRQDDTPWPHIMECLVTVVQPC